MTKEEPHPSILAYGQTIHKTFPLIMFIGREPNNATMSNGAIHTYDFNDSKNKKCGFWNMAFNLYGHYNQKSTYEIKEMFRLKCSSPIIFSDASPKGLPNEKRRSMKQQFRQTLTIQDFDHQLNSILDKPQILDRVKLIYLSGLEDGCFGYFKSEFIKQISKSKIIVKEIKFLFGNNIPVIKNQISDIEVKVFKEVFDQHINSN